MPTTTELDAHRLAYLEATVFPGVRDYFTRFPQLRSACVLVAQYWNDEAHDAVHADVVLSVLDTPNLDAYFESRGWDEETGESLKDVTNTPFQYDTFDLYMQTRWDSNEEAIPLFQAFCLDGSQEWSDEENYRPYCILRRNDSAPNGTDIQVVGQLLRPHLDGVNPEEERW